MAMKPLQLLEARGKEHLNIVVTYKGTLNFNNIMNIIHRATMFFK